MRKIIATFSAFLLFFTGIHASETELEYPTEEVVVSKFESLHIQNLSYTAFQHALNGYTYFKNNGLTQSDTVVIIDFDLPSNIKRMFIVNMATMEVLDSSLVAHGKNSGDVNATRFSNRNGSLQSSLGFYLTNEQYIGKHGLSLRLDGLEKGLNDHARMRSVVIHSADYVSDDYIKKYQRIGRSFGCPAIPIEGYEQTLSYMSNKVLLFIYSSNYVHS